MPLFPFGWKLRWFAIVMIFGVVGGIGGTVQAEQSTTRRMQSRSHIAVDMPAPVGTPIRVVNNGIVSLATWVRGYGNVVYVEHESNIQTRYAHLSKILTTVGQHVTIHEVIGLVGSTGRSTGPHVHYEVRVRNRRILPTRLRWPLPVLGDVTRPEDDIEE